MGFLYNLLVRTKLSLFIVVIIISIVLSSSAFVFSMNKVRGELRSIVEKDFPLMRIATEIERIQLKEARNLELALRLGGDYKDAETKNTLAQLQNEMQSLTQRTDTLVREGKKIVSEFLLQDVIDQAHADVRRFLTLLEKIEENQRNYEKHLLQALSFINNGQLDKAISLADQTQREEIVLQNLIIDLLFGVERVTENAVVQAERHERQGIEQVWWTSSIILLISIILIYLISRAITIPIKSLKKSLERIEQTGDFSIRAKIYGGDEFGAMSTSLNQVLSEFDQGLSVIRRAVVTGDFDIKFKAKSERDLIASSTERIKNSFQVVIDQANAIAMGDFEAVKITPRSDRDELSIALLRMTKNLNEISDVVEAVADVDFQKRVPVKSERDTLARSVNKMADALQRYTLQRDSQGWIDSGRFELNERISEVFSIDRVCYETIAYLSQRVGAEVGALFLKEEGKDRLKFTGRYAVSECEGIRKEIAFGDGVLGQAARDGKVVVVTELSDDDLQIKSAIVQCRPRNIIVAPFMFKDQLIGVIELVSLRIFSELELEFIRSVLENVAVTIYAVQTKEKTEGLLKATSQQAEVLREQQAKLQAANEELEEQHEELRAANEELEEQSSLLREQKDEANRINQEIQVARKEIEKKADALEKSNKYKSEFLANMSHELRTPLNSILLLSRKLSDNKDRNLTTKQVESAEIIHASGSDLLSLINEILDLAKVEAGQMRIDVKEMRIKDFAKGIWDSFRYLAEEKALTLRVEVDKKLPETIKTDRMRLDQIVRNIVANAIKFTEDGSVSIRLSSATNSEEVISLGLSAETTLEIAVRDTGIGIPDDVQDAVFSAFHQGQGGINRKYGGTGLGLSISRELVSLLGGGITLNSKPEQGSEFKVFIPFDYKECDNVESNWYPQSIAASRHVTTQTDIKPLEEGIKVHDKVILIIEDDKKFADIVSGLCKEKGFKPIRTSSGSEGVRLATQYYPAAVLLDINLPDINGLTVLQSLKENLRTRHIPVHIISVEDETIDVYRQGAVGYLKKPVNESQLEGALQALQNVIDKRVRELLVVEDNDVQRLSILELVGNGDLKTTAVTTAQDAIDALKTHPFDCMILDLGLPDMSGLALLKELTKQKDILVPPVIVYTCRELSHEEEMELRDFSSSIVIKGAHSESRLLDEITLFLHRMVANMPEHARKKMEALYDDNTVIKGKRVLIVDDDMRNLFALSGMLEEAGMIVSKAENGRRALELLERGAPCDIILMDIMMPEMDGYETMTKIRENSNFAETPIIALTAKAMKEDREKCLAVGASDYLPKPVAIDQLLSLLRVWLSS